MSAFLAELQAKAKAPALRVVAADDVKDRSGANLALSGADVLDDEAQRWKYFFDSGMNAWHSLIADVTFTSTFCELHPAEAKVIVDHWEDRRRALARVASEEDDEATGRAATARLLATATAALEPLRARLALAIAAEVAKSPVGMAFVKLSTRSPKDSKKALARAEAAYNARLAAFPAGEAPAPNERWIILSEETTKSGAVSTAEGALELLLDSDRVFEDLEYALRGPPEDEAGEAGGGGGGAAASGGPKALCWNMSLVARAWDPRLTPESEFRGICWDGKLTCLCQYFHPLYFPALPARKDEVQKDVEAVFAREGVQAAIAKLGGHAIIDFAWLAPGEVIVIELNPFDGVCLGTFPASTGLFLWEKPADQLVMRGEAPFEFRIRETPLAEHELKSQCNRAWREIIYPSRAAKEAAAGGGGGGGGGGGEAAAGAETRERIYTYTAEATFVEKALQPSHFRRNDAPQVVYRFTIQEISVAVNPDSKQAKWCTPVAAGGAVHVVSERDFGDAALRAAADALVAGDRVALGWNHDYVTVNRASGPERPVTKIERM